MDPKLAANIEAYRSDEALARYTSSYGFQPVEGVLIERYFPAGARVLDLACGGGRTTVPLHERGHPVIGMDLSDRLIETARKRFPHLDFRVGSYCELPFEDRSFDAVLISYNGLDYAYPESERHKALRECRRVLRDGGCVLFSSHNVKSLHCSPYYLLHLKRTTWMLRHATTAFKPAAYVEDLNDQWTYFASSDHVIAETREAGLQVIDVMGFRYSRNHLFNTFCSPWIHYVCVAGELAAADENVPANRRQVRIFALSFEFSFSSDSGDTAVDEAAVTIVEQVRAFYRTVAHCAVEQYPGLCTVPRETRPRTLFVAVNDGEVVCSARILERRWRGLQVADISFGPLHRDTETLIPSIQAINEHYAGRRFALLSVGLGVTADSGTEGLLRALEDGVSFETRPGDGNWSSIRIDLAGDDDLMRGMTKGHRSAVKRALRDGVAVRPGTTPADFAVFADLFVRMQKGRGLLDDADSANDSTANDTVEMLSFLHQHELGTLLLVDSPGGETSGGIVVVRQGDTVRYYKGAADPAARNLPVLHPAIHQAMLDARRGGARYFDLWGYNAHVGEDDQRFHINRFKKGFGGEIISHPDTLYFSFGVRGRTLRWAEGLRDRLRA